MIDNKLLRENFDSLIDLLRHRGLPESISKWPELDSKRRELLQSVEGIRAQKNKVGQDVAAAKRAGEDASEALAQLKEIGEQEPQLNKELSHVEEQLQEIELLIPNIPDDSVPQGASESDNRVEKQWGEKRDFDFSPKPHWEVGEKLGILDFERAAKISGARFAVYLGAGARLERALYNFMLDRHREAGYTEVVPPLLVREESMLASGQLPKFKEEAFRTAEFSPELYLVPTSEVPLVNLHRDEVLNESELPKNYTAFTPCFRAEAGSHGRDVRGLIRLHQFQKVELVKLCHPERSFKELENLVADAEGVLEALELPYQRVTLSAGDMGMGAAKTYDLEVWLPGQDCYREISSCSNTTDFQSRRSKVRFKGAETKKPQFVHMLNGSGLAVGRTVVAILENYQRADGSVEIPKALVPYMGGQEVIS